MSAHLQLMSTKPFHKEPSLTMSVILFIYFLFFGNADSRFVKMKTIGNQLEVS